MGFESDAKLTLTVSFSSRVFTASRCSGPRWPRNSCSESACLFLALKDPVVLDGGFHHFRFQWHFKDLSALADNFEVAGEKVDVLQPDVTEHADPDARCRAGSGRQLCPWHLLFLPGRRRAVFLVAVHCKLPPVFRCRTLPRPYPCEDQSRFRWLGTFPPASG